MSTKYSFPFQCVVVSRSAPFESMRQQPFSLVCRNSHYTWKVCLQQQNARATEEVGDVCPWIWCTSFFFCSRLPFFLPFCSCLSPLVSVVLWFLIAWPSLLSDSLFVYFMCIFVYKHCSQPVWFQSVMTSSVLQYSVPCDSVGCPVVLSWRGGLATGESGLKSTLNGS